MAHGGQQSRRNRWFIAWQALLTFISYVTAAGVLTDIVGAKHAALALVVNGGLNAATAVWVTASKPPVGAQGPRGGAMT